MTPREIADRLEIDAVAQRYFRAMDTWDYALLERVFTPDAVLRYEALGGADTRFREMLPAFRHFNRHFSFMQHLGGQLLIELDGDAAEASSTLRALHVQQPLAGGENRWVIYGLYRDRLVRRPGGWRIASRHFRQTHSEGRLLPFDEVRRFDSPPWL